MPRCLSDGAGNQNPRMRFERERAAVTGAMKPGEDLVMAGACAARGTVLAVRGAKMALRRYLSEAYLADCLAVEERYAVPEEMIGKILENPGQFGASAACAAGDGGVMAALWDFFEMFRMGFRADLRLFPIAQETVEVCEILHLNPYRLRSDGVLFLTSGNGGRLASRFKAQGIPACVIGQTEKTIGRRIDNRGIITCLDRPQPDEAGKIPGTLVPPEESGEQEKISGRKE